MEANTEELIQWETPPERPPARATGEFARLLALTLRDNPNLWAVVGRYAKYGTAKSMKRHHETGENSPFVGPEFQLTTGRSGEQEWTVYARFVQAPEGAK